MIESSVITREDVEDVLKAHGLPVTEDLVDWCMEEKASIESALGEEPTASLILHHIEDFFFREKVLYGGRWFPNPKANVS